MTKTRAELTVTLLLIAAVLWGLVLTRRIDLAFSSDLETFSGPRAYPGLILGVMLGLLAATMLQLMRKQDGGTSYVFGAHTWRAIGLFAALSVFVLAFEAVGYILTMVPLLVLVAHLCGARSVVLSVIASLCLTAVCLVIFRYGLATVLPEGVFGIDAVF